MKSNKTIANELSTVEIISMINDYLSNPDVYDTNKFDQKWTLLILKLRDRMKYEQWVSVTERLPCEGDRVLTCDRFGFINIACKPFAQSAMYWRNLPHPPDDL